MPSTSKKEMVGMYKRLSDTEKLQLSSRICSRSELEELREEHTASPESLSIPGPISGAVGISIVAFAADQTIAPGLLAGLKITLIATGILVGKIAVLVGICGFIIYLLLPEEKKEKPN
jgi:hypothetical protein